MVSGRTWTFTWQDRAKKFSFRINLAETYDITTNKSIIEVTSMQVQATSSQTEEHWLNGTVRINGVNVISMSAGAGTHSVKARSAYTWYNVRHNGATATGSIEVEHDNDGTRTVLLEIQSGESGLYFATISGENTWRLSSPVSESLTLTPIPRASDIGATNADIGSRSAIVITKKASTYTHSIKYQFGSLVGYIRADGTISVSEIKFSETSVSFLVPESFYSEIPTSASGVCVLTCTTYAEDVQIGDAKTTTFTATANALLCAPVVSGEIEDINSRTLQLTGDKSTLVRYISDALCTITAVPKNGATVVTESIGGVEVSEGTRTINSIEANSIDFSAVDSRGYASVVPIATTLVAYVKLTANVQLQRTDPTSGAAILRVWGDYFNATFGATRNTLSVQYSIKKSGGTYSEYVYITPVLNGNTYSAEVALQGLDYESVYTASVVVADALLNWNKEVTVSQGIPGFDWGQKDFRFNIPVCLPESMYGNAPPNDAKKGQLYLQQDQEGTYFPRVHNGYSWYGTPSAVRPGAGGFDPFEAEYIGCLVYIDSTGYLSPVRLGSGLAIVNGVLTLTGLPSVPVSTLLTSDGYILKDSNGHYLLAKEAT